MPRGAGHVFKAPRDRPRRFLLAGKNNLARRCDGLAFRIGGGEVGRVIWEGHINLTADEAMVQERKSPGHNAETLKAAAEWLVELLKNRPVAAGDVKHPEPGSVRAEAKAAGMSWATVRRAKDSLGIVAFKCQFTKAYQWRLSNQPAATEKNE